MAQQYIYLNATLPTLNFGGRPPFTLEEFLTQCEGLLTQEDYMLLMDVVVTDPDQITTSNEVVKDIFAFNRGFQNDLAFFRAERAKKDPADYLRGARSACARYQDIIGQAAKAENLLDGEKTIDQLKWSVWDELTANSFFEIENVIIFALKLQMLQKYQQIGSGEGGEIFKEVSDPEFLEEFLYQRNK